MSTRATRLSASHLYRPASLSSVSLMTREASRPVYDMVYFLPGFNWRLSRYQVSVGSGLPGEILNFNVAEMGATTFESFRPVNSSGFVPTETYGRFVTLECLINRSC